MVQSDQFEMLGIESIFDTTLMPWSRCSCERKEKVKTQIELFQAPRLRVHVSPGLACIRISLDAWCIRPPHRLSEDLQSPEPHEDSSCLRGHQRTVNILPSHDELARLMAHIPHGRGLTIPSHHSQFETPNTDGLPNTVAREPSSKPSRRAQTAADI